MAANAGKGWMDFIDIGWREGLLLAVVVVAVYLVVALLGLARLKRRREAVAVAPPSLVAPSVVPTCAPVVIGVAAAHVLFVGAVEATAST